jgi:hypothetical protein
MLTVFYDYVYNCFICPDINFYQAKSKQRNIFNELKKRGFEKCKIVFKDKEEIKVL